MEELAGRDWAKDCEFWLYRGAWQEWAPHEIDMAVPLSPDEVERKRMAIFKHESQKDRAVFPGPTDPREFWQRAEDRNRDTAGSTTNSACRNTRPSKASCCIGREPAPPRSEGQASDEMAWAGPEPGTTTCVVLP